MNMVNKKDVLVFGTGSLYKLNKEELVERFNIISFIDNNVLSDSNELDGLLIRRPEEIIYLSYDLIIIASSFENEIYEQLLKLHVPTQKIVLLRSIVKSNQSKIISHSDSRGLFYKPTGINGDNLAIVILSYGRVDMTVRLLTSIKDKIPDFAGEIILFDNGSKKDEIITLQSYLDDFTINHKMILNNVNYGVAKGRNYALQHVTKEWVFFIDNDIFFIDNPLCSICKTIIDFQTPYINLPLLNGDGDTIYSFGGNVVINGGDVSVTPFIPGGCHRLIVENTNSSEIVFGSFLFGGSAIYHVDSFIYHGMFDEDMFIGFEDIVFSISLLKRGVRVANISDFYMVHDHARPSDYEYNNVRYDIKTIKNSADTAFSKYGFNMYSDDVGKWLQSRTKKVI
ncbi:TPA: glycosyltransferase family 2 protein [Aeromonas hydrophila]|uniref:glycosyltransferase family 2 protein n=1 Tax=Aeromonas hydrophila TaxID=644 RepID=UPI00191DA5E9|nr:glycosyltransferase [Aeromonas hydrophila]MBL0571135.1 glycosyltransferase family 2 protein [Aeromonas hydrophila]WAG15788.1 glycosyltransferase [Aeromonas hydrophila]HDZ8913125.1 glycosyltransferase family 2 protein [Aeromonas hydrophila]